LLVVVNLSTCGLAICHSPGEHCISQLAVGGTRSTAKIMFTMGATYYGLASFWTLTTADMPMAEMEWRARCVSAARITLRICNVPAYSALQGTGIFYGLIVLSNQQGKPVRRDRYLARDGHCRFQKTADCSPARRGWADILLLVCDETVTAANRIDG
jgi:hypothetical protein